MQIYSVIIEMEHCPVNSYLEWFTDYHFISYQISVSREVVVEKTFSIEVFSQKSYENRKNIA